MPQKLEKQAIFHLAIAAA